MLRRTRIESLLGFVIPVATLSAQQPPAKITANDSAARHVADLGDPKRASRAAFELVALGTKAVPALLTALEQPKRRVAALGVLARLGPNASEAVPRILALAKQVPPAEVPPLLHAVADLAPVCGLTAKDIFEPLNAIVRTAQNAAEKNKKPKLRRKLRWEWKRTLERAVLQRGTPTDKLIEALQHADGFRREGAAYVLGWHGTKAKAAVPALVQTLTAEHPKVVYWPVTTSFGEQVDYTESIRDTAAAALIRIAPTADAAIPAYARQLRHDDPATRHHAAIALRTFGAKAGRVLPALRKALAEADPSVLGEVVTTLGTLGAAARDALPEIRKLMQHKDAGVRARAKAAARLLARQP